MTLVFLVSSMWFSFGVNGKKRKHVRLFDVGTVQVRSFSSCQEPHEHMCACLCMCYIVCLWGVHTWPGLHTRHTHILALFCVWAVSVGVCVGSSAVSTFEWDQVSAFGTVLVFPLDRLPEEELGNSEQANGSVWFIHLWYRQEERRRERRRLTWLFLIWSRLTDSSGSLSSFCSLLTGAQRRCSHRPPTPPTACADCPSALQFTSATLSLWLWPCLSPLALGSQDPRCLHLTFMWHRGARHFAVCHAITPAGWSWCVSSLFPQL